MPKPSLFSLSSAIALPIAALSIHAVMEAQIPHCTIDLPASEPICTDAVTGLKFDHQFRRSGMFASAGERS
ncbi:MULTISPECIES: hypothetical protein [unclassified Synechococcus]|uniref:hypothetical protein n=1 Tax=unclassified Synechococcus TaxID=2626047 RepID=UPI001CF85332|nr:MULTISPECIES: hypothetical protein [unclassified Synechococcus]MCB4377598.1 hypothetical protein [Synechococcus sp. MU1650]MCB4410531.1 hypothetical protein [Synechococcus sp. MU1611]